MYIRHELRKKNARRAVNRKFIEQQPRVDDIQLFFLSGAARRDSQPRLIESPRPEKNILGESLPIAAFFHYRGSRLSRLKFLRDEWKTLATSLNFFVATSQTTLDFTKTKILRQITENVEKKLEKYLLFLYIYF